MNDCPQCKEIEQLLKDPTVVHVNMLRGSIAKLSIPQIIHIYGKEALREALDDTVYIQAVSEQ